MRLGAAFPAGSAGHLHPGAAPEPDRQAGEGMDTCGTCDGCGPLSTGRLSICLAPTEGRAGSDGAPADVGEGILTAATGGSGCGSGCVGAATVARRAGRGGTLAVTSPPGRIGTSSVFMG